MKRLNLNKPKKSKKKTSNAKKFKGTGFRIVDEDAFSSEVRNPGSDSDDREADELPQIADVVDDRPTEIQALEEFQKANKWRQFGGFGETGSVTDSSSTQLKHDSDFQTSSKLELGHSVADNSPLRRKRHDPDLDVSPPRSKRHDSDLDISPPRRRYDSDLDVSPPRRKRHTSDLDVSPPRRKRHDSDLDVSPPRRKRHDSGLDISPPRQNRQCSNVDISPRRKRPDSDLDSSPRRKRHDSDLDMSPSKRKYRADPNFDTSSARRSNRHDDIPKSDRYASNSEFSPPRSKRSRNSVADKSKKSRGSKPQDSDSDLSPPRLSKNSSPAQSSLSNKDRDLSPPRRHRSHNVRRTYAQPEIIDTREDEPPKTLGGKKAGLQQGNALKEEMLELRKKEDEMFAALDDSVSGKNAKTRVRVGRQREIEAELAKKEEEARLAAERKLQYDKWGKGLKQVADQASRVSSALHEISKPLARYSNDQDLDEHLKSQDRDGDPMLKFLAKKRKGPGSDTPMYNGPAPPPNRFHIPPGYRWDGVDRSSGYEKEWFGRINARKALQEESYKWSVEDL